MGKSVLVSPLDNRVELGPYFQILEDSSKELTIHDVSRKERSDTFSQNQHSSIKLGITDSAYWFRFSLISENGGERPGEIGYRTNTTDWLLSMRRDLDYYDEIQVFWKSGDESQGEGQPWKMETYGMYNAIERGQRGPACISLSLPQSAGVPFEIYMRVVANGGINFKPILFSPAGFTLFSKKLAVFYGVYYGIAVSMLLYNLFHFFFLRERVRLIYMMYVITLSGYFFVTNELSLALIPASVLTVTGKIGQTLSLLTFALSAYFTMVFLDAKRTTPFINRLLQAIALISVGLLLALPFVSYYSILKPITNLGKVTILIIISAGTLALIRGYRPARFFLLAWVFCLGGAIIYVLNFQGLFPYAFLGAKAYQAGAGIEMVLLSLAIADRIKYLFEKLNNDKAIRQEQLNSLTDELIQSEERERRRIAGVLHDSIGQTLVAIKWEAKRLLRSCSPQIAEESMIVPYLDTCINETRTLTTEFYPKTLYQSGLKDALYTLAEDIQTRFKLSVKIHAENDLQIITKEMTLVLYRAVSELLNNVVKHARAGSVEILVKEEGNSIAVSVVDDGIGFDEKKIKKKGSNSFGLFSIKERLDRVGGEMTVGKTSGGGSFITIVIPLNRQLN